MAAGGKRPAGRDLPPISSSPYNASPQAEIVGQEAKVERLGSRTPRVGALVAEARKEAKGDKQEGKEPSTRQSVGELSSSSHGAMSAKYLQGALARLADSVGQDGGKIRTANTTEEARKALEGPSGVIAKASTASCASFSSAAGN